ncbi:MAG: 3-deoxy-manno-octulosonate cytidylyltransferase [Isosphaeraceae bacterium]|nr:MAG: 3-deoxy-manno-octulosonate cytidylyltransferase [Isosphaeraceae bacterium]
MEILGVIPARFASTRLPGKPLLRATGKTLIQHVFEAASQARLISRLLVATDDPRIAAAVHDFGGTALLTRPDHPSGTDRVAEVAAASPSADLIVNIQGDEPELSPHSLDLAIHTLLHNPHAAISTLATPIHDPSLFQDPSCVKVVTDSLGHALYFSRAPIPFHRDGPPPNSPLGLLHLGLYAYRRSALLQLASLPPSPLERAERLEQLRALQARLPIAVALVDEPSVGIDTPDDYRRFVDRWTARQAPPH